MKRIICFLFCFISVSACRDFNKPALSSPQHEFVKVSEENWHVYPNKFIFTIQNRNGIHTNFVFDSSNIKNGENYEFVEYYLQRGPHAYGRISYTFTTDSVFDWQTTNKFKLKIDSFYGTQNPSL